MKKIIITTAIVLTAGILTSISKSADVKIVKITKTAISFDRSVLATAD